MSAATVLAATSAVRSGRYVLEKAENDFGGFFGREFAVVDGVPGREVVQFVMFAYDVESAEQRLVEPSPSALDALSNHVGRWYRARP